MPYIGNVSSSFNVGTANIDNGAVTGDKLSTPFDYDSGTLYLDNTNNRVGVGTTNPSAPLAVTGANTDGVTLTLYNGVSTDATIISNGASASHLILKGGAAASVSSHGGQIDLMGGGSATDPGAIRFRAGATTGEQPERARIDSSGNFIIATNVFSFNPVSKRFTIDNAAGATALNEAIYLSNSASNAIGAYSPSIGFDVGGGGGRAEIYTQRGSTFGGNLSIRTDNTSGTSLERLRITDNGTLRLYNSPGIDFSQIQTNAAGVTAEILDSYEEGTYTVQLFDAVTGGNASATTATGHYTKVGRLVTASISISNFSTAGMTGVNALHFSLPFTSAALAANTGSVMTGATTLGANGIIAYVAASVSRASLYEYVSGAAFTQLTVSDFTSGTADIISSITYHAA